MGIVTITTDFGEGSPYVAEMKGALLSISPTATIVDIKLALRVTIGKQTARWVTTYCEGSAGECVNLWGSGGWLEIAVVAGNARQMLDIGCEEPVTVELVC